ncbi:hypothetical protein [Egbenema bharatensis]|uniref:hypothetical protein n=1 Tax=Egbenema bharatensis TaxID=3463334 RepID=UPI003A87523E
MFELDLAVSQFPISHFPTQTEKTSKPKRVSKLYAHRVARSGWEYVTVASLTLIPQPSPCGRRGAGSKSLALWERDLG